MTKSKNIGSYLFDSANTILLLMLVVMILYPLWNMAIVSVSAVFPVMRGEVRFWPIGFNLDAYRSLLARPSVVQAYGNTLLYTAVGTLINVVMTALCAYPLSRKDLIGKSFFTVFIVITMLFSGGMIPTFLVVNSLGLYNTMWAIVLPPAINVWYMIIMRTFFQNIPHEIHEAAYMDGANDLHIFVRIILPLSVPVLATMLLFYSVWHWNSFFPSLIYLNDVKLYPIQLIMRSMVVEGQASDSGNAGREIGVAITSLKYAVIMITILPIVCVYPFIQKYFVKGAMIGSLKG
jgi:putative aldouronate transport system permease protein